MFKYVYTGIKQNVTQQEHVTPNLGVTSAGRAYVLKCRFWPNLTGRWTYANLILQFSFIVA